jgi:hypothetical protein
VDELLWELNDNEYYTIDYADDIAILSMDNLSDCVRGLTYRSRHSSEVVQ